MITEAIILAGGFGTRLQGVIKDIPKPMAPINKKPFLEYLFNYLLQFKVNHVILSVGFKHEIISDYFNTKYKSIHIEYAIEKEPLGTGGGITNAMKYLKNDIALIINGDTFFNIDLNSFYHFHYSNNAELTIALKKLKHFDRYGTVILNKNKIIDFHEKNMLKKDI